MTDAADIIDGLSLPTLRALARKQQADIEMLRHAAKIALDEMCKTIAPRNSFTDAVDLLDAAISRSQ